MKCRRPVERKKGLAEEGAGAGHAGQPHPRKRMKRADEGLIIVEVASVGDAIGDRPDLGHPARGGEHGDHTQGFAAYISILP